VAVESVVNYTHPFPHTVIENFLSAETIAQINAEWPTLWVKEDGKANRKWSTTKLPPTAKEVARSIDVAMVEKATGIAGLFQDRKLFGGGLHCIPRGGFLKMHVDFNRHPKGWHRRVNLLVYLNQEWRDEWGGDLELGLTDRKKIAPLGGRCVIFETNDHTWHGHPLPLECPEDVQRRSLALYFYTKAPPPGRAHTTIYNKAA
jgi:hypothetical protein